MIVSLVIIDLTSGFRLTWYFRDALVAANDEKAGDDDKTHFGYGIHDDLFRGVRGGVNSWQDNKYYHSG